MREERPRLRPLKVAPAELALRIPIMVGPTGTCSTRRTRYSMPPDAIGIPGTLYLYRDRVRIVAGRFEAVHAAPVRARAPSRRCPSTARSASPPSPASGPSAICSASICSSSAAPALEYLTELTHRRPRVWIRDVERLHELLAAARRRRAARGLRARPGRAGDRRRVHRPLPDAPWSRDRPRAPEMAEPGVAAIVAPGPSRRSSSPGEPVLDLPSATASQAPRGGRVQAAAGARRVGAQRSSLDAAEHGAILTPTEAR